MRASIGARASTTSAARLVQAARPTCVAKRLRTYAGDAAAVQAHPISITERALQHLHKLKADKVDQDTLLLRVGVRSGGCSGMSYVMDFETSDKIGPEDQLMDYDGGLKLVCDPKSLLYLFGMNLDYSDALVGGGFQFMNPNAEDTCGCGKSFGV